MGDVSAEPSMEDILSSIKRIIAEEGDAVPARQRRAPRAAAVPLPEEEDTSDLDAVLELNDPIPTAVAAEEALPRSPAPAPEAAPTRSAADQPVPPAAEPRLDPATDSAPILSREATTATRGSLEALSRMMVKPEPGSDGTLEGLVRDLVRPMLREWLDAKLPPMVEQMVAAEIARITGQPG